MMIAMVNTVTRYVMSKAHSKKTPGFIIKEFLKKKMHFYEFYEEVRFIRKWKSSEFEEFIEILFFFFLILINSLWLFDYLIIRTNK